MTLPKIAISIGDPAGVGAEITLKALADRELADSAAWMVIADRAVLEAAGAVVGIAPSSLSCSMVDVKALGDDPLEFGKLSATNGLAAVEYVRVATEMCLRGDADAMVTAPLNKEAVTLSGQQFSGHTEYIAQLCQATESRMLLVNDKLATVHVTTHVPLRRACQLEQQRIVRTIELGDEAMRLMRRNKLRVAVCGLNPHAGEHGLFGTEDEDIIAPAVEVARQKGIDCSGPYPADTIFLRGLRGEFDLIVAMYHDQGHIPMKLIDFEKTVNVSLGIPIIRTSVDHGTAFDIAGKNIADATNMKAAMQLAVRMAAGRLSLAGQTAEVR
ncbi:MAG: 4-hydroxythreonine-4-phosphate dehydrogenase PdxA [Acidobacteriaceae bacterium]